MGITRQAGHFVAFLIVAMLGACEHPSPGSEIPDAQIPDAEVPDAAVLSVEPTISIAPASGNYRPPLQVVLSLHDATGEWEAVVYTLDGSVPSAASTVYTGALALTESATLRYAARGRDGRLSTIHSTSYVVDGEPPVVSAAPSGGTFAKAPEVTLSCTDRGSAGCSEIRYTVDGSAPSGGLFYGAPVRVSNGTRLRFVAFDRAGSRSDEGAADFHVDEIAPSSTVDPSPGSFGDAVDVALACDDGSGVGCAGVRYTVDGTDLSSASPIYRAPLHLDETTTVCYQGVDALGNEEPPRKARYVVDRLPPVTTAKPPAGAYRASLTVALSCLDADTACVATRYTLDGSAPGPGSPVAAGPIAIAETATLRFASVDSVGNVEAAGEARYVIDTRPPVVRATPPAGSYGAGLKVTLSCTDDASGCAGVWYTLDGTTPTQASTRYETPIALAASATLRTVAFDVAGNASGVAAESYALDTAPPRLVRATPPEGSRGADPATLIELIFDEPLDAGSLSGTVNGASAALAYDEGRRAVTITPSAPLAPDSAYLAELTGVRDAFGSAAGRIVLSFRTRGTPVSVGSAGSATVEARGLAYDAAGNGIAIFSTYTGKGRKLLAARWDAAAEAWGAPNEVAREDLASAAGPFPAAVASDGGGFIVVWSTAKAVMARSVDSAGALGPPMSLWTRGATELAVTPTRGIGWAVFASISGQLEAVRSLGSHFELPESVGLASGPVKLISRKDQCLAAYRRTSGSTSTIVVAVAGSPGWSEIKLFSSYEALSDPDIAENDTGGVGVAFTIRGPAGATMAFASDHGSFLPGQIVANVDDPTSASIAATAGGFAVAWQGRDASGGTVTQAAFRPPGPTGTWTAPETIWTAAGPPAATRLAPSADGWVALAATGGEPSVAILSERGAVGWSAPVEVASAVAPLGHLSLGRSPSGQGVLYDQDDGQRLRVRAVRRAAGAVEPAADLLPPLAGSAREVRLVGDGAGSALAVWTAEHRGGPAVFAAPGRGGAFQAPVLVALGADQPATAASDSELAIVYRRGRTCEARVWGAAGLGPAARLDVAATTSSCSAPKIASDGRRFIVAWAVGYDEVDAAVYQDSTWSAPVVLARSSTAVSSHWDLAGQGERFVFAWGAYYNPPQARVWAGPSSSGWAPAVGVGDPFANGGLSSGPALAAGPEGFAVLWTYYNRVWASLSADGATWRAPELLETNSACSGAPALTALPDGFAAVWDCDGPRARVWRKGWLGSQALSAGPVAAAQLASGAPGAALLLRESAGSKLLGTTLRGDTWAPVEMLRSSIAGEATLSWDGETWITGWAEPVTSDATLDGVVVRRGL